LLEENKFSAPELKIILSQRELATSLRYETTEEATHSHKLTLDFS